MGYSFLQRLTSALSLDMDLTLVTAKDCKNNSCHAILFWCLSWWDQFVNICTRNQRQFIPSSAEQTGSKDVSLPWNIVADKLLAWQKLKLIKLHSAMPCVVGNNILFYIIALGDLISCYLLATGFLPQKPEIPHFI